MEDLNVADYCDAIEHQAWTEARDRHLRPVKKDAPKKPEVNTSTPDSEAKH